MERILVQMKEDLKENVDQKTKDTAQRFFKEAIKSYGIKTSVVTKISKKYFREIKGKQNIFLLCEELFRSGYLEESFIACNWSYNVRTEFEEKDMDLFQSWIEKYISNWASCDTLCNHTVGAFIEKFPKYVSRLKMWAKSENRWMRRAAAVTLIIPAKRGLFLSDAFDICDILLEDKDDMVQKGYGWLLKEESRKCQKQVFQYVVKNKKIMPRTALRYAIELMPADLKTIAMEKA